jgi:hypothetical protein
VLRYSRCCSWPVSCPGKEGLLAEPYPFCKKPKDRHPLEPVSALRQITEDENLRKSLAERGKIQLGKFDFSAEVARLPGALTAAASSKSRHRKGTWRAALTNFASEGSYFSRA